MKKAEIQLNECLLSSGLLIRSNYDSIIFISEVTSIAILYNASTPQ